MTHSRAIIRDAIASRLRGHAGLSALVGSRVYVCRVTPPRVPAEVPCINLMTSEDRTQEDTEQSAPRRLWHSLSVTIEAVGYGSQATLPDALDALCEQVESAMAEDETFGGSASDSWLTGTEIAFTEDGQQHIGIATMTYRVDYDELVFPSTGPLDNFDAAQIRFNLGGVMQPGDEAEDMLEGIHE